MILYGKRSDDKTRYLFDLIHTKREREKLPIGILRERVKYMRWLTVRLRARRINRIAESRLREKYMTGLELTEDNEQQADLCAQFEMRRRRVTAEDIKLVRAAKRCGVIDWEALEKELERTLIQRILG